MNTKTQLSLEICQEYGRIAFQDEQKGVEAMKLIEDYIEEYQSVQTSVESSQARQIAIERNQSGVIVAAKTVKLLPNVLINLRTPLEDIQKVLSETSSLFTISGIFLSTDPSATILAILYFIQFVIDKATIKLKPEHAGILVILYHLAKGELQLEIPLAELQKRVAQDFQYSVTLEQLDNILEDLVDLHCILRQNDVIYLKEKIIITDK
jgi:hypothetical protein